MDELEHFKTQLNFVSVAETFGYEMDRRNSSKRSVVMHSKTGEKIIVATSAQGQGIYFNVRDVADNGTIIDFIMRRCAVNLGGARKILRSWKPSANQSAHPVLLPVSKNEQHIIAQWLRLRPYSGQYLQSRGISEQTIAKFANKICLDERRNTCFPHEDRDGIVGWEIKNKGFTGYASSGRRGLWGVRIGQPDKIVLTESAIDCMSYEQLHGTGNTLYISVGGSLSQYQKELLAFFSQIPVLIATDADKAGDAMSVAIQAIFSNAQRHRPELKDWNDVLAAAKQNAVECEP